MQCKERKGRDRKKEGAVVGIEGGANITLVSRHPESLIFLQHPPSSHRSLLPLTEIFAD